MKGSLPLLYLITTAYSPHSWADYEAQFEHSKKRWLNAIEYYSSTSEPIEFVYYCKSVKGRDELATEFGKFKQIKTDKKEFGYEAQLAVFHPKNPSVGNELPWLKRNFYIGITYGCDLDAVK